MSLWQVVVSALAGVVFGLALAAPPGPMNAVIAEESVVSGWRAGFTAGLGAMTADACFLVGSLAGAVAVVQQYPRLQGVMFGIGGLLLLYFAVGAVRNARGYRSADAVADGDGGSRGFRRAFVLAITNPYQVLFWLTVGVGLLRPGTVDVLAETPYVGARLVGVLVVETGSPALLLGLFGGIVVWIISFPALLVVARERLDTFAPAVAGASAVAFVAFGLAFLADGLTRLL